MNIKIKQEYLDQIVTDPISGQPIWLRELDVELYNHYYNHYYKHIFEEIKPKSKPIKGDDKNLTNE